MIHGPEAERGVGNASSDTGSVVTPRPGRMCRGRLLRPDTTRRPFDHHTPGFQASRCIEVVVPRFTLFRETGIAAE